MRRHAASALALGVIAALVFAVGASSEPVDGVEVPHEEALNALDARVTELEQRVDALEAERSPSPTTTPTESPSSEPTQEPSPTPTEEPTPTPTEEPTATETPSPEPTEDPDPTGPPTATDFPTQSSVGPTAEPTQTYAGDCYFDVSESNTVIENRIVDCNDTGIRFHKDTSGVMFRDSVIRGSVGTGQTPGDPEADDTTRPIVFTIEDSRVVQSSTANGQDRAVCCSHFVVRRSLLQGTHSGLWAFNKVTLTGNYITTDGTDSHSSGARVLKNGTLRGNTIVCKPVTPGYDGGCSAAAVFYREFGVTQNLSIEGNYFKRGVTQGGEPGGPWFATRFAGCNTNDDCVNITFTGNLFSLGWGTDGGEFPNDAGDVWADNYWANGLPALSGQVP